MMPNLAHRVRHQSGGTLIEILVTLVILLFGLLGLFGVSSRAYTAELEALQRVRALQLVQDMASRVNANRKAAGCYSDGATGIQLGTGTTTVSECTAASTATEVQKAQAKADLIQWDAQLKGEDTLVAIAGASKGAGALINAVGCIQQTMEDTATVYLVSVAWQGLAKTAAPAVLDEVAKPCGSDSFGDDALHRLVTTKIHIGNLAGATP